MRVLAAYSLRVTLSIGARNWRQMLLYTLSLSLSVSFPPTNEPSRWPRAEHSQPSPLGQRRALKGPEGWGLQRAKQFATETRDERTRGQWQAGSATQSDRFWGFNSMRIRLERKRKYECQRIANGARLACVRAACEDRRVNKIATETQRNVWNRSLEL